MKISRRDAAKVDRARAMTYGRRTQEIIADGTTLSHLRLDPRRIAEERSMLTRLLTFLTAVMLSHAALAADAPPAPTTPQAEAQALLEHGLGFAEQSLRKHGELQPFGFAMRANGEITAVAPSTGGAAPAQKVVEQLDQAFRTGATSGEYKATAIFTDARVTSKEGAKTDAVQAGLEHRSGYCVDVYVPYTRSAAGEVRFAEQFTVDRDGVVFGACK